MRNPTAAAREVHPEDANFLFDFEAGVQYEIADVARND